MLVVARAVLGREPHAPPGNRPSLPFAGACAEEGTEGPQHSEAVYIAVEEETMKNKQVASLKTMCYWKFLNIYLNKRLNYCQ